MNTRSSLLVTLTLLGAAATGCIDADGAEGTTEGDDLATIAEALVTPGYQIVVAETAVGPLSAKQLRVSCPGGRKALGAGWADLDATGAILTGVATYSAPSFDGASWMVNARNLSAWASDWKLRVHVVCATPPRGYVIVTVDSDVSGSPSRQVAPTCPTGKRATGAGFGVLDRTGAILDGEATQFLPAFDGSGWLINARNNAAFAPTWKLRGALVCATAAALPGYQAVTQTSTLDASDKQVSVACPTGTVTTGAGWGVLDGTDAILDGAATTFTPRFDGTGWLANAQKYSAWTSDWKLRVRALCVQ